MKVRIQVGNGVWLETEGTSPKEVFKEIAIYSEIFGEKTCGQCSSPAIQCQTRTVDDNEFFAMKCMACGAELSFGLTKVGGKLFPKRKTESGDWDSEHRGWKHWNERRANTGQRASNEPEPF